MLTLVIASTTAYTSNFSFNSQGMVGRENHPTRSNFDPYKQGLKEVARYLYIVWNGVGTDMYYLYY